jgi:LPXTG-motif cell wall-anchored protein
MDNAFMSFYGDSLDGIMGDLWIFSQSKKIAASHMSENYLAWLTSFGSTSSSNIYLNKYDVKFGYAACPVDIEIYDHAELIGKIIDNEVTYEDTVKVQLYVDGDVKYFWMPQDSQYTIKFAGTDTGTMDYFVADFDMISEQLLVQKSFQDVALYDGKEMISEITDTPDVKLLIVDGDNITGEVFEDGSESIPLQSIALNKATLSVIKGQTETLTVTYNPNGTTEDKTISWKTSDSKVAMVDASGVVTAVAKGTAIITATARSGATAECSVTVTDDSESDGDDDTTSATEQPAETITKPGENTTESSSIEEPSQSTTDNTSLNSKNNPDTGDNSSIWMFVFAFIFSAVLLAVTIRKKPRSVN